MRNPGVVTVDLLLHDLWVEDVNNEQEVRDAVVDAVEAGLGSVDWQVEEDLTKEALRNEMAEREFEIRKDER